MSLTRKFAAAAALATVATVGLGVSSASASPVPVDLPVLGQYLGSGHGDDWSLVDISDNNVGPFQICNNDVPVNVLGVQVPLDQIAAILGLLGNNVGNDSTNVKDCAQDTVQDN